jgi:hypothetical protein
MSSASKMEVASAGGPARPSLQAVAALQGEGADVGGGQDGPARRSGRPGSLWAGRVGDVGLQRSRGITATMPPSNRAQRTLQPRRRSVQAGRPGRAGARASPPWCLSPAQALEPGRARIDQPGWRRGGGLRGAGRVAGGPSGRGLRSSSRSTSAVSRGSQFGPAPRGAGPRAGRWCCPAAPWRGRGAFGGQLQVLSGDRRPARNCRPGSGRRQHQDRQEGDAPAPRPVGSGCPGISAEQARFRVRVRAAPDQFRTLLRRSASARMERMASPAARPSRA